MTFEIVRNGSRLHSGEVGDKLVRSFTPFKGSSAEQFPVESDALKLIASSRVFYSGCSVVKTNYLFTDDYYQKSLQHINQRSKLTVSAHS